MCGKNSQLGFRSYNGNDIASRCRSWIFLKLQDSVRLRGASKPTPLRSRSILDLQKRLQRKSWGHHSHRFTFRLLPETQRGESSCYIIVVAVRRSTWRSVHNFCVLSTLPGDPCGAVSLQISLFSLWKGICVWEPLGFFGLWGKHEVKGHCTELAGLSVLSACGLRPLPRAPTCQGSSPNRPTGLCPAPA